MSVQVASQRPVLLVVGGSSGIGLAVAHEIAHQEGEPWQLVLLSRDRGALASASLELPARPQLVTADVTSPDEVEAAIQRVLSTHGRLDAVVTTAQVMAYGTVEEVPHEVFAKVVETAIHGTANLVRSVLPVFRAQGHGTLVVVNSLLGEIAVPSMSAYCASKWGQLGLVRSLQLEVRDDARIHVCLVSPGAVDTPIYEQAATYAGRGGAAPPPVVSAERVAKAVVSCLDQPRRHVEVGPANALAVLGFRLLPAVYDRMAAPLAKHVVLRGPVSGPDSGNVLRPRPEREAVSGGWTLSGRRRDDEGHARWRVSGPSGRRRSDAETSSSRGEGA